MTQSKKHHALSQTFSRPARSAAAPATGGKSSAGVVGHRCVRSISPPRTVARFNSYTGRIGPFFGATPSLANRLLMGVLTEVLIAEVLDAPGRPAAEPVTCCHLAHFNPFARALMNFDCERMELLPVAFQPQS